MNFYFYILLFFLLYGCEKETIVNEDESTSTQTHDECLIWKYEFTEEDRVLDLQTFVNQNHAVLVANNDLNNFQFALFGFSKSSGDSLWTWNQQVELARDHIQNGNIIYFYGQLDLTTYAVDMNTGQTLWTFTLDHNDVASMHGLSFTLGKIFITYTFGDKRSLNDSCYIYSIDPQCGAHKLEFKLFTRDRNNFQPGIWEPVSWIHPNGDTILICQSRSWCWSPSLNQGRGEFFAINLSEDDFYFDFKDFFGTNDVGGTPIIKDDILYISSGWEENAAIDLVTKEVIWRTEIPEGKRTGNKDFVLVDDKLFFNAGNIGILNIVDAKTGKLIRSLDNVGKSSFIGSNLVVHNDFIHFNTAKGFFKVSKGGMIVEHIRLEDIMDVETGIFGNGLAVDPATGYFYAAANGKYFTCFKLND